MGEDLLRALVNQGGFAVLAAAFGYLGFRGAQMWVADVKASSERERLLTERVLDLTAQITAALTAQTSQIQAIVVEQQGMRTHFHALRNAMTALELLTDQLTSGALSKRVRVKEGTPG